jgi:hypothetical protein
MGKIRSDVTIAWLNVLETEDISCFGFLVACIFEDFSIKL